MENNKIQSRFTNGIYDSHLDRIYLIDDRGILYCFDTGLNLIKQSISNLNGVSLHGIAVDEKYVFTRDVAGNIIVWDKLSLSSLHFIVSQHFVEEGETNMPVPCPSHAIVATDNQLVFCNAVGSLSFLNKTNFEFEKSLNISEGAFLEHLSTSPCKTKLFVNDIVGSLSYYDLKNENLTPIASLNSGVSHSVAFDKKFERFLITSDVGGGIYIATEKEGITDSIRFTNDDVEEIVISEDAEKFYVCCFDHYIYVFDNHKKPLLKGTYGPFKFQVNHLKGIAENKLLAILESGEAYILSQDELKISAKEGGSSAYWDLILNNEKIIATSESGQLDLYKIKSRFHDISLEKDLTIIPKMEPQRLRISCLHNNEFISVGADGVVVKFTETGAIVWSYKLKGILRDISLSPCKSKVAVCSEIGELNVLDSSSGTLLHSIKNTRPIWCVAYCNDGTIVFGERELRETDDYRTPARLVFLDKQYHQRGQIENYGNHKRIKVLDDDHLLVSSNTTAGVFIASISKCLIVKNFLDWQINTPENAAIHNDLLFVITYGYQLITYNLNTKETIDVQYVLEGYPKGLCIYTNKKGITFLILSCRNAIMSFRLTEEGPSLVSTRYLFDSKYIDHSKKAAFNHIEHTRYQLTTSTSEVH